MFEMIGLVGAAALPFAGGMWSALLSGILGGFLICDCLSSLLPFICSFIQFRFTNSIFRFGRKFEAFGKNLAVVIISLLTVVSVLARIYGLPAKKS
jgi:hypothetical protein